MELQERLKREGTYVYLWLIHADMQKPWQYGEAIILQLKTKDYIIISYKVDLNKNVKAQNCTNEMKISMHGIERHRKRICEFKEAAQST